MTQDRYFPTVRRLAEYEIWCNTRSIQAAFQLTHDQLFQHFPFGFSSTDRVGMGTIHETLFHIVLVFERWSHCVGPKIALPPIPDYNPHMDLKALADWNTQLSENFLKSIDTSHTQNLLHLDRRLDQFFHLITHGTHHRTQFITMLRMLGKDPPFEAGDFGGWSNPKNPH